MQDATRGNVANQRRVLLASAEHQCEDWDTEINFLLKNMDGYSKTQLTRMIKKMSVRPGARPGDGAIYTMIDHTRCNTAAQVRAFLAAHLRAQHPKEASNAGKKSGKPESASIDAAAATPGPQLGANSGRQMSLPITDVVDHSGDGLKTSKEKTSGDDAVKSAGVAPGPQLDYNRGQLLPLQALGFTTSRSSSDGSTPAAASPDTEQDLETPTAEEAPAATEASPAGEPPAAPDHSDGFQLVCVRKLFVTHNQELAATSGCRAICSPGGGRVASAVPGTYLLVEHLISGDIKRPNKHAQNSHSDGRDVKLLSWSPDSSVVVCAGSTGLCTWFRTDGSFLRCRQLHDSGFASLAFSPTGIHFLSGGLDMVTWVLKGQGEEVVQKFVAPRRQQGAAGHDDDGILGGSAWQEEAYEYDLEDYDYGPVVSAAWCSDTEFCTAHRGSCRIRVWKLHRNTPVKTFAHFGSKEVTHIDIDPSGTMLVSAGGGDVTVFSLVDAGLAPLFLPQKHSLRLQPQLWSSNSSNPQQHLLLTGRQAGGGCTLEVLNPADAAPDILGRFKHPCVVHVAALSPDGQLLATADDDKKLRIFAAGCAQAGQLLCTAAGELDVCDLCWRPGSSQLVAVVNGREEPAGLGAWLFEVEHGSRASTIKLS